MDRHYGHGRLLNRDYSFLRSIAWFPLKGKKKVRGQHQGSGHWNALIHPTLMQFQGEVDFTCYIYCKEVQKSLWTSTNPFTVALVCTISGKNTGAGIRVSGLGRFPIRVMKLSGEKHRLKKREHGRMRRSEGYFQNIFCRSVGTSSAFAPTRL